MNYQSDNWLIKALKEINPINILMGLLIVINSVSIFVYKINQVGPRFDKVEARLDTLEKKAMTLETEIKVDIASIKTDIKNFGNDIEVMKNGITRIAFRNGFESRAN